METKLALYIALVDAFVLLLLMLFIRTSLNTYFSEIWELLKDIRKRQEEIQAKQKEIEEKQEVTLTYIQCK